MPHREKTNVMAKDDIVTMLKNGKTVDAGGPVGGRDPRSEEELVRLMDFKDAKDVESSRPLIDADLGGSYEAMGATHSKKVTTTNHLQASMQP